MVRGGEGRERREGEVGGEEGKDWKRGRILRRRNGRK